MKISASIYSDKTNKIEDTLEGLISNQVDLIHVDCEDNIEVFEDIKLIKAKTKIPVDLHIITSEPEKFYSGIKDNNIEFVTFQYENLPKGYKFPKDLDCKFGLSIITPTGIEVFEDYKNDCSLILIMATIPGKSGGSFDVINFQKIRDFQIKYPDKKIHVDGGVNSEVSFILRNLGVHSSVSGSFLFNSQSIGYALLSLKSHETESHILVKDFMRKLDKTPIIKINELNLYNVLETIEKGKLGFCVVVDENNRMIGIISNADVRKAMIKDFSKLPHLDVEEMVNTIPIVANENYTVFELLKFIKKQNIPIMYLPIINDDKKISGVLTFVNLIKGEL